MSGETTSFLRQGRYRQRRILLSNVKSSGMPLDQDVGDARDLVVQPRTLREQRPCWYRATQAKEPTHVSRLRTAPLRKLGRFALDPPSPNIAWPPRHRPIMSQQRLSSAAKSQSSSSPFRTRPSRPHGLVDGAIFGNRHGIIRAVERGTGSGHPSVPLALLCLSTFTAYAQPSVRLGNDSRLVYSPDALGNQILDFSSAGYGGGASLPIVPARIFVRAGAGHDRQRIQAAIDLVSAMPSGADGFRGAVLLSPGVFAIDGSLRISSSGLVLRGSGSGENGTVLHAAGVSRRTLIEIAGQGPRTEVPGSRRAVTDDYVPVGAMAVTVGDASGFHPGDRIVVLRPSTAAWISLLRMDQFQGWRAPERLH